MDVADEVREQEQRFLLVLDRERPGRRLILQNLDGGIDGVNDVVIVGAGVAGIILIALNGEIGKMIGVGAATFAVVVHAGVPVATDIVLHARRLRRRLERLAWFVVAEIAVVLERAAVFLDATHTVRPWRGDA